MTIHEDPEQPKKPESPESAPSKPLSSSPPKSPKPKQLSRPNGFSSFPVGKPPKIDWLIVKDICQRIQKGEFLTDIQKLPGMPNDSVFRHWCEKNPKIHEWVERSRKVAASVLAEKSVTLFFEEPVKEVLQTKNGSYERISMSGVQRERYKSQAMQWLATKWNPETYGDKMQIQGQFDIFSVIKSINGNQRKAIKNVSRAIDAGQNIPPVTT